MPCLRTHPPFSRPVGNRPRSTHTIRVHCHDRLRGRSFRSHRTASTRLPAGDGDGDDKAVLHYLTEAAQVRGFIPSHVALFPMPTVDDVTAHLLEQDVVWVFGGSVAGLLAMWRLHGVDEALGIAWQAGVVLTGTSAGSICWHAGGTTDSFGPQLQPVTNGLGFLPYANGVHYDSEDQRRPLLHELVGSEVLPSAFATDDGAGLVYRGTQFVEAIAENNTAGAYFVERCGGAVTETALGVRRLQR